MIALAKERAQFLRQYVKVMFLCIRFLNNIFHLKKVLVYEFLMFDE
jgi:hypothetical protein